MDRRSVERNAVAFASRYLVSCGYEVENVSRVRGHNGYDLIARKVGETLRIEVKGCTVPWGIPDAFGSEFDEQRRLVADYLYVVYFLDDARPKLCVIPRDALDPALVRPKLAWKISSRFKNARTMTRFLVPEEVLPVVDDVGSEDL